MMKAYPEYKDSGVVWLGEIPSDWGISKSKYLLNFNMGQSPDSKSVNQDGVGLPFIQGNAEFGTEYPTEKNYCTEPTKICNEGDLLISVRAPVGAMNIANKQFVIGRGLSAITATNKIDRDFLWYSMIAQKEQLSLMETGTTFKAVSGDDLKNIIFSLPSLDEQKAIAKGLKKEVGRIDNLISEKENFINLLSEKRQALISHVVTKGLNPNVPMKDSGVEWIGEIPEHWVIEKVKHSLNSVESGTSVNSEGVPASEGKLGVLKTSCVSNGFFEPEENKQVLEEDIKRVSCPVKENRLIVSRMNTPELVGAAAYTDSSYSYLFLPDRLWQIEFENRVNTKFIYYWTLTNSYRDQIKSVCVGTSSSMQNLSQEDFKNFKLPVPKLSVQNDIVAYIERSTEKIRLLKEETVKSIELLKEHRTALISAAVTGKIDVREEV